MLRTHLSLLYILRREKKFGSKFEKILSKSKNSYTIDSVISIKRNCLVTRNHCKVLRSILFASKKCCCSSQRNRNTEGYGHPRKSTKHALFREYLSKTFCRYKRLLGAPTVYLVIVQRVKNGAHIFGPASKAMRICDVMCL